MASDDRRVTDRYEQSSSGISLLTAVFAIVTGLVTGLATVVATYVTVRDQIARLPHDLRRDDELLALQSAAETREARRAFDEPNAKIYAGLIDEVARLRTKSTSKGDWQKIERTELDSFWSYYFGVLHSVYSPADATRVQRAVKLMRAVVNASDTRAIIATNRFSR